MCHISELIFQISERDVYRALGAEMTESDELVDRILQNRSAAWDFIDRETMGRIYDIDLDGLTEKRLVRAAISIAYELVRQQDHARKTSDGVVLSSNTDGYAEAYASGAEIRSGFQRSCRDILRQYLGSDPYGLLYQGL